VKDFDENDALERTAGDQALLGNVLRFALEDIPPLIQELQNLLETELFADAARLAHKVKGSAGACGAQKLYLAALNLEMAARDSGSASLQFLNFLAEAFESFKEDPHVRRLASLDDGPEASIG
jgi:HPt (histidine-containing phosphotransfer) domain-containing protein